MRNSNITRAANVLKQHIQIVRSPLSETRYLHCGEITMRLSTHALGVADYGSRPQHHAGPEVVVSQTATVVDIVQELIDELLDYYGGCQDSRMDTAVLLRRLLATRRSF